MDWLTKHRLKRARYWPELMQYWGSLPHQLSQQITLLMHNLAIQHSTTGQFPDILQDGHCWPLLDLQFWLLDDWGIPESEARQAVEKHVLLAMVFSFAAMYTRESILYRDSLFDERYSLLENILVRRATFHLAQLFPEASPFWIHHESAWGEYAEALLWGLKEPAERAASLAAQDVRGHLTGVLAPARIPVAAAAVWAGKEALLPQLLCLVDHLSVVLQVQRDLSAIRCDLWRGHHSYPMLRTMQEAGMDCRTPYSPERLLGALILSGTVEALCHECLAEIESAQAIAAGLNLPTWRAYGDSLARLIQQLLARFSLKTERGRVNGPALPGLRVAPAPQLLSKVIAMAEGYLLSDLSFREAWEVQRFGVFNRPELTARAFPSGLIVEILCRQGYDPPGVVDGIFKALQASGFRYYDEVDPAAIAPDADDLALALRLYPYSRQKPAHRELLQTPLRGMEAKILPSGEIPVWLTRSVVSEHEARPLSILYGNSCTTVTANLLIGLAGYDWEGYRDLIERCTLNWCERWLAAGVGAIAHYGPLYSLWVGLELTAKLSALPIQERLRERLAQVSDRLLERLTLEARRPRVTPQDAALLTLACLRPAARSLFDPGWITALLKSQRWDGSWEGEPVFVIPNRGELTSWYTSRTVTTAHCYHALKSYRHKDK